MQKQQIVQQRSRIWHAVAIAAVIVLGLATRSNPLLPPWLAKAAGDALWALCAFLVIGCLTPTTPSRPVAVITLAFAYAVEFTLSLAQSPPVA